MVSLTSRHSSLHDRYTKLDVAQSDRTAYERAILNADAVYENQAHMLCWYVEDKLVIATTVIVT